MYVYILFNLYFVYSHMGLFACLFTFMPKMFYNTVYSYVHCGFPLQQLHFCMSYN